MNSKSNIQSNQNTTQNIPSTEQSSFDSKNYSLQGLINKLNQIEGNTVSTYNVNINELYSDVNEANGYMKKYVSLFNSDLANKNFKVPSSFYNKQFLTHNHFSKFSEETLFYIFYYLPRDSLQNYAAEELCKRKWRFHTEYNIWFNNDNNDKLDNIINDKNEKNYIFFNPHEWKTMKYLFEPLNEKAFYDKEAEKK